MVISKPTQVYSIVSFGYFTKVLKKSIGEASLMAFAICMVLIQDRHNHHHSNDHNESSNCYGPNDLITIIDISQRHEHQDL